MEMKIGSALETIVKANIINVSKVIIKKYLREMNYDTSTLTFSMIEKDYSYRVTEKARCENKDFIFKFYPVFHDDCSVDITFAVYILEKSIGVYSLIENYDTTHNGVKHIHQSVKDELNIEDDITDKFWVYLPTFNNSSEGVIHESSINQNVMWEYIFKYGKINPFKAFKDKYLCCINKYSLDFDERKITLGVDNAFEYLRDYING